MRRAPFWVTLVALGGMGCNDIFGLRAVDRLGDGGSDATTTSTTGAGAGATGGNFDGGAGGGDPTSTTKTGGAGGIGGSSGGGGNLVGGPMVVDVDLGEYNACALVAPSEAADNEVRCWGAWDFDITGAPMNEDIGDAPGEAPLPVAFVNANPIAVTLGHQHACALLEGGKVRCWGSDNQGQLAGSSPSADVDFGPGIVIEQISAGGYFTCALSTTRQVFCWGNNGHGAVAEPVGGIVYEPAEITLWDDPDDDEEVVEIAAGYAFVCARLKSSRVRCWGNNDAGQCGKPASGDPVSPLDPPGITNAIARLAPGRAHVCARTPEQEVLCWGDNSNGQLGRETSLSSHEPAQADLAHPTLDVASGDTHTCAVLDVNGVPTAKCWGAGAAGQRGTQDEESAGSFVNSMGSGLEAVNLPASFEPAGIMARGHHACALAKDSRLACWGLNEAGVLGVGAPGDAEWGDQPGEMGEDTLLVPLD